ncbi:GAF domain-containing protein [Chlorogloeopsis sp. ULAP01]|uniref:GAF domain-containing sensor histidine kinase n=1 Tax=Chlorogloeopsis sp. ULAP01 TaxID=3056483 RepID=UPI0025AB3CB5|nr:GAF domain-containing protein [Chlorogloeopsis sp. ULAP01]MDM9384265.1 GAF domain-containing protein [Chlorogloeopsis sp. ULAP01]
MEDTLTIKPVQSNSNHIEYQAEQQKALARVIAHIRESLDIENIFKTSVIEIRQLLNADRVVVFRFFSNQELAGEFIFEDVAPQWNSVITERVHDHCFSVQFAELYQQGRVNAISDIEQQNFSECYIQLLQRFQVRANIVVPLLKGEQLWGLLCIHQCSSPRTWQNTEIEFVIQIAEHLGVALQHIELLNQARYQAELQKALNRLISRMRESLDLDSIFKTTVTEVRQLLSADRVVVFRFNSQLHGEGQFIYEDRKAIWNSIITKELHHHGLSVDFKDLCQQSWLRINTDIYQANSSDGDIQILEKFQVRGYIVASLIKGKEIWGLLCIHQCSNSRLWETSEIEFVQQIAEYLEVALQQADYIEQVKAQSAQLAQVAARERTAEWQRTAAITIEKIRQSLDLETIFRTTTQELRQLLNADRVGIYRFNPDWSGEFVFESAAEGWISLIQAQLQQPEIRRNISECSAKDLADPPVVDTYLQDTQGGRFARGELYRTCDDIYNASFNHCYLQVLETYQARAYAIVAIYHHQKLWGLLAVYQNSKPRKWQEDEVYLLTQISTQLGVALQHAEFMQQMQTQAAELIKADERQRALATTVEKIRQTLDIDTIFKTTTQEVRQLLEVERVAIYRFYPDWSGEFVADSIVDGWQPITKPQPVHERLFSQSAQAGKYPRNEVFVPISQGEKLWGLLVAYQNSQPRYWQDEEINLLAQVGIQLGVALQQAEAWKQVQKQAQKLAQAAEREKALAVTVEKIRQSLDLDTIFATTTQEVRQLLEVDRVAIYRFWADWSGEFVAESVAEGWKPVKEMMPVVAGDYLQQYQGGRYAQGNILVVNDIHSQNNSSSHLAVIEQIQAKAYMIVPIFLGEKLWGLLAAYQNIGSRDWQKEEVDLLIHIANQLGVGLQQAELLKQTQHQKEELAHTLQELQQTQAQLIQSEKMAGLGQLVAGIAHEINNPVNFIFGNISYVAEYTENLLKMLHLYQQNYPHPTPEIQEQAAKMEIDYIAEDLPTILKSVMLGAERISELVMSLRTFSRLDHAEMKPVDIHEGIDSTLLILQHRLKNHVDASGIEIVKEYGELPLVECFPARLNQVFMNILGNAIDALEDSNINNPQIQIRTQLTSDNSILICIQDNGPGIIEQVRTRIFDPFFTTKEPGKGTGLGLSISYQIIVDKHGGQIKCLSEPGRGCEFWIEIPIVQSVCALM